MENLIDLLVSSLKNDEQTELLKILNKKISPILLKKILNFLLLKGQ